MTKKILSFIAVISLVSCGNLAQGTSINGNDSLCIADTTVTLDAKQDFSIEFKTFHKQTLLKADYKRKNIYHENSITLEWPVKAQGLNLDSLQHALSAMIPDGNFEDPQEFIDEWAKQMWAEHGWEWEYHLVDSREEDAGDAAEDVATTGEEEEEDEAAMQFDTSASIELTCIDNDSINHFITFMGNYCYNNGCGLGSCIFFGFDHLVYDYVNCRKVELSDIIANEKEAVRQLKEQCINGDEYSGLEGLKDITELPTDFRISNNTIFVQFDKYEISFGADGCPELGFDVSQCPEILTDYGKQVFRLK